MSQLTLAAADYAVICGMLLISTAIGLYFRFTGDRQRTTREFLLADQYMKILPVSFSIMATNFSSIVIIGRSAETYLYGTQYFISSIFTPIGIIFGAYIFLPIFFDLGFLSINEYLEKRFGKTTRTIVSSLFTLKTIFYMAVVVYTPSLALNVVTGVPLWASILSISLVTTCYSFLGGMKAVIWTDVFQALLMYTCVLAVIIKCTLEVGGLQKSMEVASNGGRFIFFDFTGSFTQRYTFWNTMASGFSLGLGHLSLNQLQVQRLSSLGSLQKAKRCLWTSLPLIFVMNCFSMWTGIAIYSLFHDCDPILQPSNTVLSKYDQLVPYTILTLFQNVPCVPGLCIAGIFSASLSTISSGLNALAMLTMEDFIRPFCSCRSLTEKWIVFLSKLAVLGLGTTCLLLTFMVANFRGIIEATHFLIGMIGGPTVGVFLLGLLTVSSNEQGVLMGLVCGLGFSGWWTVGAYLSRIKFPTLERNITGCEEAGWTNSTTSPDSMYASQNNDVFPLYRVSFMWLSSCGTIVVIISGYICSRLVVYFQNKEVAVDPRLISPVLRKWLRTSHEKKSISCELQDRAEKEEFLENTLGKQLS